MAILTTPDSIPTPASGQNYALTTDLAATADGVQAVLTTKANYGVGTTTERTAALSRFPDGSMWYDTTLSAEYRRVSGAWVAVPAAPEDAYNYRWANAAARTAQAGMAAGDKGYQTDTLVEYLYSGSAWVANPVTCALLKSTDQALTTSAAALSWNVEISDNSGMHDNSTNNTRITFPLPGLYEVSLQVYNSNASGTGTIYGRLNGTTDVAASQTRRDCTAAAGGPLLSTFPVTAVAGDYLELMALHSTATGSIVGGATRGSSVVSVKRVAAS